MITSVPIILLPSTAVASSDIYSNPQQIDFLSGYCVVSQWTGSGLARTVQLECSLDYNPGGNLAGSNGTPANSGTWVTITGTPQTISGPGNYAWNVWPAMYTFFRLRFIYSAGPGTISALARLKG